ncbi:hypothetical protein SDC9_190190 [bioreactor metagenome]|uniref:Uncharacterized protein n=1 Tax=bioreactor metagenome TaxID=1076179 RepID=A0A645I587_9ZZZZ
MAVCTGAAGPDGGQRNDIVADLEVFDVAAFVRDDPYIFMAHDDGRVVRKFVLHDMDIRAADAAGQNAYFQLILAGGGFGHVHEFYRIHAGAFFVLDQAFIKPHPYF